MVKLPVGWCDNLFKVCLNWNSVLKFLHTNQCKYAYNIFSMGTFSSHMWASTTLKCVLHLKLESSCHTKASCSYIHTFIYTLTFFTGVLIWCRCFKKLWQKEIYKNMSQQNVQNNCGLYDTLTHACIDAWIIVRNSVLKWLAMYASRKQ